jgi:hypothetical protein
MTLTTQGETGDRHEDPTRRRLWRLHHRVSGALERYPDEVPDGTGALFARLERDSIELVGFKGIRKEVVNTLCEALHLSDVELEAVLLAGAGLIGVFAPLWTYAPPVSVLGVSPEGFDPTQVVGVSRRPGRVASRLEFEVRFQCVRSDDSSPRTTITLEYTQKTSTVSFQATMLNPDPSGGDQWRAAHLSSPKLPKSDPTERGDA